jgi:hypothetical protein
MIFRFFTFIVLSVIIAVPAFADLFQRTESYKANVSLRPKLQKYREIYLAAHAENLSQSRVAAHGFFLDEIEAELQDAGFTAEQLARLESDIKWAQDPEAQEAAEAAELKTLTSYIERLDRTSAHELVNEMIPAMGVIRGFSAKIEPFLSMPEPLLRIAVATFAYAELEKSKRLDSGFVRRAVQVIVNNMRTVIEEEDVLPAAYSNSVGAIFQIFERSGLRRGHSLFRHLAWRYKRDLFRESPPGQDIFSASKSVYRSLNSMQKSILGAMGSLGVLPWGAVAGGYFLGDGSMTAEMVSLAASVSGMPMAMGMIMFLKLSEEYVVTKYNGYRKRNQNRRVKDVIGYHRGTWLTSSFCKNILDRIKDMKAPGS